MLFFFQDLYVSQFVFPDYWWTKGMDNQKKPSSPASNDCIECNMVLTPYVEDQFS